MGDQGQEGLGDPGAKKVLSEGPGEEAHGRRTIEGHCILSVAHWHPVDHSVLNMGAHLVFGEGTAVSVMSCHVRGVDPGDQYQIRHNLLKAFTGSLPPHVTWCFLSLMDPTTHQHVEPHGGQDPRTQMMHKDPGKLPPWCGRFCSEFGVTGRKDSGDQDAEGRGTTVRPVQRTSSPFQSLGTSAILLHSLQLKLHMNLTLFNSLFQYYRSPARRTGPWWTGRWSWTGVRSGSGRETPSPPGTSPSASFSLGTGSAAGPTRGPCE